MNKEKRFSIQDFVSYLPEHQYFCMINGQKWTAGGLNACFPIVCNDVGPMIKATIWLDQHQRVETLEQLDLVLGRRRVGRAYVKIPPVNIFKKPRVTLNPFANAGEPFKPWLPKETV